MQRRVNGSVHGSLPQKVLYEQRIDLFCIFGAAELCLFRKRIGRKPVGQQKVHAYAPLLKLRSMHMKI